MGPRRASNIKVKRELWSLFNLQIQKHTSENIVASNTAEYKNKWINITPDKW